MDMYEQLQQNVDTLRNLQKDVDELAQICIDNGYIEPDLYDKYEVKRVSITVENTDGSLSAIKPSSDGESLLNEGMIVTRSEKPLHDGDRVRLEDYSGEK